MANEFPEATARPWHLHGPFSTRVCDGRHATARECTTIIEAEVIKRFRTEAVANIRLAHAAVNSYDALRAALIGVVNDMGCWCKTPFLNAARDRDHEPRCQAVRAALHPQPEEGK